MKKSNPDVSELLKTKEDRQRDVAHFPPARKFAVTNKMRGFEEQLRSKRKHSHGRNQKARATGGSR